MLITKLRGLVIILFSILIFSGCFTSTKISNQNLSYIYWNESSILHPKFIVFHLSDSISRLYYSINSKELLYSKEDGTQEFSAAFAISFKLYPSLESKELLDSASLKIDVPAYENPDLAGNMPAYVHDYSYQPRSRSGKEIVGHIDFNSKLSKTYLLEVKVLDIKRNQMAKTFINVDKRTNYNRQNFLTYLSDPPTKKAGRQVESQVKETPVFRNTLRSQEPFTVRFNDPDISTLFVKYYKRPFPIALPPFSLQGQKSFRYDQDSSFVFSTLGKNDSNKTAFRPAWPVGRLQKEGFYHFQIDTVTKEGLPLFKFYDGFPKVTSIKQLIGPLRYITTKQEYEGMIHHENKKIAVDNFWIKATGNPDRGKKIIREYYNRVQDANEYFTSYLEGWKTDRGMAYIVYGPPDVVYKTSFSESWVYGEEGNLMSLNFTFVKVNNPFTDNDYILNRLPIYKSSWYMAVEAWRQGIIY